MFQIKVYYGKEHTEHRNHSSWVRVLLVLLPHVVFLSLNGVFVPPIIVSCDADYDICGP